MDEDKDRRRTVEVVDTSDQPAEGGPVVDESAAEHDARMHTDDTQHRRDMRETQERKDHNTGMQDELAPLFNMDSAEKFRTRWLAIQSKFVDDPGESVKEADELVADVIQDIMRNFADRRGTLEHQWSGGGNISTEDLRIALKQYRSFFDRLLSLQS